MFLECLLVNKTNKVVLKRGLIVFKMVIVINLHASIVMFNGGGYCHCPARARRMGTEWVGWVGGRVF